MPRSGPKQASDLRKRQEPVVVNTGPPGVDLFVSKARPAAPRTTTKGRLAFLPCQPARPAVRVKLAGSELLLESQLRTLRTVSDH